MIEKMDSIDNVNLNTLACYCSCQCNCACTCEVWPHDPELQYQPTNSPLDLLTHYAMIKLRNPGFYGS